VAKKKKEHNTTPPIVAKRWKTGNGAITLPVSPLFRLTLLFGLYMAIFHVILYFLEPTVAPPMQKAITVIVSRLLTSLGIVNTANPDAFRIILTHDTWNIDVGCTAIGAMILYVAFILAYTSSAKAKLSGILWGIPFIAVMNIVRLLALGWITEYFPRTARLFHDYVWETVFLFIVIGMWFIWIEKVVRHEKNPAVSR
jgi:exosortase/archaeosortase family protein